MTHATVGGPGDSPVAPMVATRSSTTVRVVPVLTDGTASDEVAARALLVALLDDTSPGLLTLGQDEGAALLDGLVGRHRGCRPLAAAARLLRAAPAGSRLVLGWSPGPIPIADRTAS